VRYWPPTNSFLLLGVLTSVLILVKINQEMRPWECSQTDWQTQTHFIICSMLHTIAMRQIIIDYYFSGVCLWVCVCVCLSTQKFKITLIWNWCNLVGLNECVIVNHKSDRLFWQLNMTVDLEKNVYNLNLIFV